MKAVAGALEAGYTDYTQVPHQLRLPTVCAAPIACDRSRTQSCCQGLGFAQPEVQDLPVYVHHAVLTCADVCCCTAAAAGPGPGAAAGDRQVRGPAEALRAGRLPGAAAQGLWRLTLEGLKPVLRRGAVPSTSRQFVQTWSQPAACRATQDSCVFDGQHGSVKFMIMRQDLSQDEAEACSVHSKRLTATFVTGLMSHIRIANRPYTVPGECWLGCWSDQLKYSWR